jgi:hypothetical protein
MVDLIIDYNLFFFVFLEKRQILAEKRKKFQEFHDKLDAKKLLEQEEMLQLDVDKKKEDVDDNCNDNSDETEENNNYCDDNDDEAVISPPQKQQILPESKTSPLVM